MTETPAGWFPDPQTPGQLRYWDGAGWTAHTQPGPPVAGPRSGLLAGVVGSALGMFGLVLATGLVILLAVAVYLLR